MKSALRAWRIGRVLLRYRLDDLLDGTAAERWLRLMRPFVPSASREVSTQSRGARLRLALQELGPIFVKFGQILSTRRDLVPPDIAEELTLLQDRVAPFDGMQAVASLDDAIALAGTGELCVIGGGEVFTLAMPLATRMHLTWVHTRVAGADAFFPHFYPRDWRACAREPHPADAAHAFAFDFVDYERA